MSRALVPALLLTLALGVLAGFASGCSKAQAKPIEVTYYYLPG